MSSTPSRTTFFIYGLTLLLINAYQAVKINSIDVPSVYELNKDSKTLKLDCDFTVDENETGFALKWLYNTVTIYQWIPLKKVPYSWGTHKGRVDLNTVNSDDPYKKHSALIIPKPFANDSGVYSCSVATFQSSDKKSANLLIIDPANSVDLSYRIDSVEEVVTIDCHIKDIIPHPEVTIFLDNEDQDLFSEIFSTINDDDVYDVHVTMKVEKRLIRNNAAIKCLVKIPDSSYEFKASIEYKDLPTSALAKALKSKGVRAYIQGFFNILMNLLKLN